MYALSTIVGHQCEACLWHDIVFGPTRIHLSHMTLVDNLVIFGGSLLIQCLAKCWIEFGNYVKDIDSHVITPFTLPTITTRYFF